jgi:tRNA/rRNA methyltransferase/tRNA (cytidine32/uridine32-2'-O)-methyltransferase
LHTPNKRAIASAYGVEQKGIMAKAPKRRYVKKTKRGEGRKMPLSNIMIVLSRPSESGNVGAVCRAMKNMGLSRLSIVAPEMPLDDSVIRARAVHAADVWEHANHFDTLQAALADCSVVIGTTRRLGEKRKNINITPRETAAYLMEKSGQCAIVFGNERTGLEKEELDLCNIASYIPADDVFPSLNLSHAVQIFTYELFLASTKTASAANDSLENRLLEEKTSRWVPVERNVIDSAVKVMTDSLESIGFYKQFGREDQERFLRDVFARAEITLKETRYLEELFKKMAILAKK